MLETMTTDSVDRFWPYLLFLPANQKARDRFMRSVLASRLARGILSSLSEGERVLQRDLVGSLPHSNKSVLSYLRILREFGLIRTGTTIHNGKRVVYHELTKNGWGLARFYFEGLPSDVEQLTAYLLENYLTCLATLYREQGIPESALFEIFARMRAKAILDGSPAYSSPEFIVFGASAFNTKIDCEKLPASGGFTSCSFPMRYPGGPSVELSLALSTEGHETTFVSSVGNDMDGWNIITNLIQGGVDVRHIIVDDGKHTNESIILNEKKRGSRTLVGVGSEASLSITSPDQVPWTTVENTRAVYIGEVFVEVAVSIAAHARAHGIPVLYRCSIPFWDLGLNRLRALLSLVDVLLISNRAWKYLKRALRSKPIQAVRRLTDARIIIRETPDQYLVIDNDMRYSVECTSGSTDITQWLAVGLMRKLAEESDILEAMRYAVNLEKQRLVA